MKSLFLLSFLLSAVFNLFGQADETESTILTWIDMEDVVSIDRYDDVLESYIVSPIFGPQIRSFENKQVEITGYVVFVSEETKVVMLSRNDFSSCFFCGGAGPESVMEVYLKEMPKLERDRVIKVEGTFKLNPDDPTKNFYLLEEAIVVDQ